MAYPVTDNLYQAAVIQHSQNPIHYYALKDATHQSKGYNPICGDDLNVFARIESGRISEATFTGDCCAVCKCSASLMVQLLEGKSLKQVKSIGESFENLLNKDTISNVNQNVLGDLMIFKGIWKYPSRIKCALLPWHALKAAVNKQDLVSTE